MKKRIGGPTIFEVIGTNGPYDVSDKSRLIKASAGFAEAPLLSEGGLAARQSEEVLGTIKPSLNAGKQHLGLVQSNLVTTVVAVLILSAVGLLAFKNSYIKEERQRLLTITKRSASGLLLPDGTNVWLDTGSSLSYGREFGIAGREVTLEGSAFFDMTKEDARPFIVHTRAFDVEARAAVIDLRVYKTGSAAKVFLQKGRAVMQLKDGSGKRMLLQPGKSITYPIPIKKITEETKP